LGILAVASLLVGVASFAAAADVGAELVAREGLPAPGTPGLLITVLNSPFTNSLGQVGFTGAVDNGGVSDSFVWLGGGVVWRNSDALPMVLGGAESTMGISDAGGYIYSPSVDGNDAVWTDLGLLAREDDPAPDFPGQFLSFASRPQMSANGTAYFIAGLTDAPGGATQGRVIYRAEGGVVSKVLATGDIVGGFVIQASSGIDFDYDFSDDSLHHIHVLDMDTGSTADDFFIYVDGNLVAREGDPTGEGDNWDNLDNVSINVHGDYIFTGDTDGATTSDEFIAYNGAIVLREGDTIGGVELTSTASLNAVSLNNVGQVAHLWTTSGSIELLFVGNAADLRGTSVLFLATNDLVDVDGDGMADYRVTDFNASGVIGPGLDLSDDGSLYVEVDLETLDTLEEFEGILRLFQPGPCAGGNVNLASGSAENVLLIEGTEGGTSRSATVPIGVPFTVSLNTSSAGPNPARYLGWIWYSLPGNPTDLMASGLPIGCTVNPTPLDGGLVPQPFWSVVGMIAPARAVAGTKLKDYDPTAPWTKENPGVPTPFVATIQLVLEDNSTSHPRGFSVTNSVSVIVE